MKRTLCTLAAAFAFGISCAAFAPPAHAAATPKPSATPNDQCASKKSKWEHQQCENYSHSAPGDEYFGKMKMSYLGINNTFRDESIRAGDYTTDSGIINKVSFADDSLHAWAQKYPGDPQLARSYFLAIAMFKKIYVQTYQDKAWDYMHVLVTKFGDTYFGKLERADLKRGFTEHYFALAQVCPTPLPSGVAISATPEATPAPTAAPGHPNVNIITPPCVPAAAASPAQR